MNTKTKTRNKKENKQKREKDQCCVGNVSKKQRKHRGERNKTKSACRERAPSQLIRLIRQCVSLINPHTPKKPLKNSSKGPQTTKKLNTQKNNAQDREEGTQIEAAARAAEDEAARNKNPTNATK